MYNIWASIDYNSMSLFYIYVPQFIAFHSLLFGYTMVFVVILETLSGCVFNEKCK